jgi:hypothetical protein
VSFPLATSSASGLIPTGGPTYITLTSPTEIKSVCCGTSNKISWVADQAVETVVLVLHYDASTVVFDRFPATYNDTKVKGVRGSAPGTVGTYEYNGKIHSTPDKDTYRTR